MRKHGISGPIEPQRRAIACCSFPWHVMKDTVMMAAVFASLITVAALFPAHLDEIANPTDASYIPRPEWYFLSLFQMLKYFPGPLEPVATMVIAGARDRVPGRCCRFSIAAVAAIRLRRPRRWLHGGDGGAWHRRDRAHRPRPCGSPPHKDRNDWGLLPIAGQCRSATGDGNACIRCHENGGPAAPLAITRLTKDNEWLLSHMADPVVDCAGRAARQRSRAAAGDVALQGAGGASRTCNAYARRRSACPRTSTTP